MRRRLAELEPTKERRRYIPHPRPKPDFIIRIESRRGDRTQLSVTRFGKQFITEAGIVSARHISRGIEMLLRYASP